MSLSLFFFFFNHAILLHEEEEEVTMLKKLNPTTTNNNKNSHLLLLSVLFAVVSVFLPSQRRWHALLFYWKSHKNIFAHTNFFFWLDYGQVHSSKVFIFHGEEEQSERSTVAAKLFPFDFEQKISLLLSGHFYLLPTSSTQSSSYSFKSSQGTGTRTTTIGLLYALPLIKIKQKKMTRNAT